MTVYVSSSEPKFTAPDNNRFWKTSTIIIRSHGAIGVRELAQQARISEGSAYQGLLAFRGVTKALRDAHLLPYDAAPVGEPASVSHGEVLTIEDAARILGPGPHRL